MISGWPEYSEHLRPRTELLAVRLQHGLPAQLLAVIINTVAVGAPPAAPPRGPRKMNEQVM